MRYIYSYIGFDANGMPVSAGASWDISALSDFDVPAMGSNHTIFTHRDGTETLMEDSKQLYPIKGTLILQKGLVDKQSAAFFNGDWRYLGPVLYRDYSLHFPLVIFQESEFGSAKKCYYIKLIPVFDPVLASHMTLVTNERHHLPRMESPDYFRLDCQIIMDGIYNDIADINSATWDDRSGDLS